MGQVCAYQYLFADVDLVHHSAAGRQEVRMVSRFSGVVEGARRIDADSISVFDLSGHR